MSLVGEVHIILPKRGKVVGKTPARWKEHRMWCQKNLHLNPRSVEFVCDLETSSGLSKP